MRTDTLSRCSLSPIRRYSSDNSPLYGNMGSTIGPKYATARICHGPEDRPYFMDTRELQWVNPSIKFPLPAALTRTLDFLRILLSSKDHTQWLLLRKKLTESHVLEYSIAPRWLNLSG